MTPWDLIEKFGLPIVALVAVSGIFYRLFAKVIIPFFMKQIESSASRLDDANKAFFQALSRHDDIVTKEFKMLHDRLDREHRENMERLDVIRKRDNK